MLRAALLIGIAAMVPLPAEAGDITAESTIESVTVFPQGAGITRRVPVSLPAGDSTVILPDLPAETEVDSLTVSGTADQAIAIGSVETRVVPAGEESDPWRQELLDRIERIVNEQIYRNTPVQTDVQSTQEAMASGAMALFGEKYGDTVRVVSIPGFSMELCGGTHVRATGDIGFFAITQESGVAAGVRRIEALTGEGAVRHYQAKMTALARFVDAAGAAEDQAPDAIAKLRDDLRRLARENEQLRMKVALGGGPKAGGDDAIDAGGTKLIARRVEGLDKSGLRAMADQLRDRLQSGVVVLAAEQDAKVLFVVAVTKDLAGRLHAGNLAKELAPLVGGKGGGRPDFAEAGGKDPSALDALLARARDLVARS